MEVRRMTPRSMATLTEQQFPSVASSPTRPLLKKLSVLMPVYNERWTVEEIVSRVLDVCLPLDLELIIVDDGSTDGSWEVVENRAAGDPLITAVRHPRNRGKGAAVRTAIEHARGDVVVIQDADLEY